MGTIVFSLDTETVWGRINESSCIQYLNQYRKTSDVTFCLIDLFEKYQIPATWAFVGLAIAPDDMLGTFKEYKYKDVYSNYEQVNFRKNIELLGEEIKTYSLIPHLEQIRQASVQHEIGSHTFSHLYMGWQDEKERSVKFQNDLELFQIVKEIHNLNITSFIYPRNFVRNQNMLKEFGYKIYRQKDVNFSNKWLRRINEITPMKSFTVKARLQYPGLIELPGSMLFRMQSRGVRKYLPISLLYRKACQGLINAIDNKEVFHIWFHPFNFAFRSKEHFYYFEKFLRKINQYRQKGQIQIKTMKEVKKKK